MFFFPFFFPPLFTVNCDGATATTATFPISVCVCDVQAMDPSAEELSETLVKLQSELDAGDISEEDASALLEALQLTAAGSAEGTPAPARRRCYTPAEIARMTEEEQIVAFAELDDSADRDDLVRDVTSDLNPFDVVCPYCACCLQAFDLPSHVAHTHADREAEEHRCPICYLASRTQPPRVALAAHLRAAHSDCRPSDPVADCTGFRSSVLDHDLPESKTCPVCYDVFHKGDEMVVMACMCMFHKKCISEWWERGDEYNGKCILHK